jgi:succinate-acetate transporter protein
MLIASTRVSTAVFMVFLTLEITEILLVIGFFRAAHNPNSLWILHAGGWAGVVTAGVAWYTSAAGVWNGVAGRVMLPVGGPLVTDPRAAAIA